MNIGAGSGSYEPAKRYVIAIEPSSVMRSQRIQNGKTSAINAKANNLPFDDNSFDASMALDIVHNCLDMEKWFKELRRVTKNQIGIMTFDPGELDKF